MNYEVKHVGPKWAGLDWYQCPYCTRETPDIHQMDIHVQMMHPEKFQVTLTHKELVELAKQNKISYQGNKQQIAERLAQAGISL